MLPEIPIGHTHLFTEQRANQRGYWLVRDDKGYDYALGHTAVTDKSSEIATAMLPSGSSREWRKDRAGQWTEVTSSTCVTRWIEAVPLRLRSAEAWHLPTGQRAAGSRATKEQVESWTKNPHRGGQPMYLWGPPGTGKSQTAVWVGNILSRMGVDGEWMSAPNAIQQMRESYSGDKESWIAKMARWVSVPFLVVDDIGAEGSGKDVSDFLYRIADARHNAMLATIYTSNVGPALLGNSGMDPRTVSRISSGVAIELTGRDRRKTSDYNG